MSTAPPPAGTPVERRVPASTPRRRDVPAVVGLGAAVLTATTLGSIHRSGAVTVLATVASVLAVGLVVVGLRVLVGRHAPVAAPLAATVLSVLGCVTAERLDPGAGVAQGGALLFGLLLFLGIAHAAASHRLWPDWLAPAVAALALALFALSLVPGLGHDVGGAQVGVVVAGMPLQVSEIARPALMAVFATRWASSVAMIRQAVHPYRRLLVAGLPVGASAVVLGLAADRGPLLVLGVSSVVLVLMARPGLRVIGAALGVPAALVVAGFLASPTLRRRISEMTDPDADGLLTNLGAGLRSVARGGWFGTGVGRGHPESVRFAGSDFVLTQLAEERGAIGALIVLGLLAVLVRGSWAAAGRIADPARRTVATAMVLLLAVQTIYTCAGVLGVVPLTGMTLPFVSRGGSSLIGMWLTLGLVVGLGTSRRAMAPEASAVAARCVTQGAFVALALLMVSVVLVPPVAVGVSVDVDWARDRGVLSAADGTVLARTSADGTSRTYPGGPLFSDVVGFTEPGAGAGLELSERTRMSCEPRWWQSAVGSRCAPAGVVTTLVPGAQRAAAQALAGHVGDVVALDVSTGDLLAGYSTDRGPGRPTGSRPDGADVAAAPAFAAELSSPGSVFKLVTATAALDAGVNTDTPVRDEYVAPAGTRPVHNAGGVRGGGSLESALVESSNTAFGEIATRAGTQPIAEATSRLLTWPAPAGTGPLSPTPATIGPTPASPDALTRTGFGQEGVRTSPLALAVLGADVADGGVMHVPRAVAGTCVGEDYVADGTAPGRPVIPAATVARLRTAMSGVADRIPALAGLPGEAGAKTGTAERPDGRTDGLVVAYAPREHPRVAVAVRVEATGDGSRTGGTDAGPVAAAVLRAALTEGHDTPCSATQNH